MVEQMSTFWTVLIVLLVYAGAIYLLAISIRKDLRHLENQTVRLKPRKILVLAVVAIVIAFLLYKALILIN